MRNQQRYIRCSLDVLCGWARRHKDSGEQRNIVSLIWRVKRHCLLSRKQSGIVSYLDGKEPLSTFQYAKRHCVSSHMSKDIVSCAVNENMISSVQWAKTHCNLSNEQRDSEGLRTEWQTQVFTIQKRDFLLQTPSIASSIWWARRHCLLSSMQKDTVSPVLWAKTLSPVK